MNDALYQAHILDHYRKPRNKEVLEDADKVVKGSNPSCGDNLELYIKFEGDTIKQVTFQGEGCAISQATTSMLTEKLTGITIKEAKKLSEDDVYTMLGVEVTVGRQKCALLAYRALQKGLV